MRVVKKIIPAGNVLSPLKNLTLSVFQVVQTMLRIQSIRNLVKRRYGIFPTRS